MQTKQNGLHFRQPNECASFRCRCVVTMVVDVVWCVCFCMIQKSWRGDGGGTCSGLGALVVFYSACFANSPRQNAIAQCAIYCHKLCALFSIYTKRNQIKFYLSITRMNQSC